MSNRAIQAILLRALRAQRGNVAVLFALSAPLVVGGAALGVETTYWRYKQVQLQAAADAAAFAAATEKRRGSADAAVYTAASEAAGQNGFPASGTTASVSFPASVNGTPVVNAVRVALETHATRFFTAYFDTTPVTLGASATANYTSTSQACILALDPAAAGALNVWGSAQLTLQGCSLMSNSISAQAVTTGGSSRTTAPCIVSAGGVAFGSTVTLTECAAAMTEAAAAADPYKAAVQPTPSNPPCANDNKNPLEPGTYCGGLSLNKSTTLKPGIYVINGGDFRLNGGADISGAGVTIVLTGGGRVSMNGNPRIRISAPTTGPYAGILFFGDRASTGGADNVFNGTPDSLLTGALYFPSQAVEYKGNFSGQGGCTQVVARTIEWTGNATVSMNCSALGIKSVPVPGAVKLIG